MLNLVLELFLIAALAASLYLFVSLKREILHARRANRKDLDEAIEAMLRRLEEAEQRTTAAIEHVGAAPTWMPAHAGMNLSKRIHALRLWRKGEGSSHIAAAVAVPEREVDLLIRVQEAVARSG